MNKDLITQADNMSEPNEARDIVLNSESQRAMAETQAAMLMAVKRPRTETQSQLNLRRTLERKSFCEKAIYVFPRAGEKITGPSINLAREIARLWGNIKFGYKIVYDVAMDRTVEGFAWDLETNSNITEQISFKKIREKKDYKTGKLVASGVSERDLREITAKHGALAVRNCILQLIPRDIVDDAVDNAVENLAKNIEKEDIKMVRVKTLHTYEEIGVFKADLETYLNHSIDTAISSEIAELRSIYKSIKDGVSQIEEYFPRQIEENQKAKKIDIKQKLEQSKTTPPPAPVGLGFEFK